MAFHVYLPYLSHSITRTDTEVSTSCSCIGEVTCFYQDEASLLVPNKLTPSFRVLDVDERLEILRSLISLLISLAPRLSLGTLDTYFEEDYAGLEWVCLNLGIVGRRFREVSEDGNRKRIVSKHES